MLNFQIFEYLPQDLQVGEESFDTAKNSLKQRLIKLLFEMLIKYILYDEIIA